MGSQPLPHRRGLPGGPGAGPRPRGWAGWGPEGALVGVGRQPWQVALLATRPGTRGLFVERDQKLPYHICFSPTFASWLVQRPLPAAFTSAWGDSSQVPPAPPPASGSSRGALSPRGLRGREAAGHLPCQSAASQPQAGGRASAGFLCRLSRGPGRAGAGQAGACLRAGWGGAPRSEPGGGLQVWVCWGRFQEGLVRVLSLLQPSSSETGSGLWRPPRGFGSQIQRGGVGGEGAVGREAQIGGEAQGE